jgi:hypothetical protein
MVAATLSDTEIAEIRATLESQMFQTAQVYRRTLEADDAGGQTGEPELITESICRVMTADKRPGLSLIGQVIGERIENRDQFTITFPHDADVQEDDIVLVGSRQYRVLSVSFGDWEFSLRAAVTYDQSQIGN